MISITACAVGYTIAGCRTTAETGISTAVEPECATDDPRAHSEVTKRSPDEQAMDATCASPECGMRILTRSPVKDDHGYYCAEMCQREARAERDRAAALRRLTQPASERKAS